MGLHGLVQGQLYVTILGVLMSVIHEIPSVENVQLIVIKYSGDDWLGQTRLSIHLCYGIFLGSCP
jgi:hypothetical protein